MRIFFMLALFATGFLISTPAMAQSETWQYFEERDPSTNEIAYVYTAAFPEQEEPIVRYVVVGCTPHDGEMTILAIFGAATESLTEPARIELLIDEGEVMEFTPSTASGDRYIVKPPRSIALARMLANAKLFITTNGYDEYMQFKSLAGGKNVMRVLKFCGL